MLTPNDVRNKEFEKAKFGGYHTEDVDNFLEEIARTIEQLWNEQAEQERKMALLAEKLEEYRNDEESMKAALIGAQKLGDSVVRESRHKAEAILADANHQADQIVERAKRKIENEQFALFKIQKEVSSFKKRLMTLYQQHVELIRSLPGEEEETAAVPAETPAAVEQPAETAVESPVQEEPAAAEPAETSAEEPEQTSLEDAAFAAINEESEEEYSGEAAASKEEEPAKEDSFDMHSRNNFNSGVNTESRFGPLKFGAGYDLTRDRERRR